MLERLLLRAKASQSLGEVSHAVREALRVIVDSGPLSDFLPSLSSLAQAIHDLEARQVEGADCSGRSVSRQGSDPDYTLSLCIEDARDVFACSLSRAFHRAAQHP